MLTCVAPLSGAVGGLLATGLAKIEHGGYNRWPWIFFVEGAITVCYGICAMVFMPDTPAKAKFLTKEERVVALHRMKVDSNGSTVEEDVGLEKFDWHWVKMAVMSPNTWICSMAWFFLLIPLYVMSWSQLGDTETNVIQSFSLFLPTIIQSLGYTSTVAQAFTAPPNLVSFAIVLITAASSDRVKARGPFMIGGCLLGIIGYAILIGAKAPATRYGGTFFVAVGVYLGSPMVSV